MPDPNRLLTTLHRAAQALQATPGRRGRVVTLAGATDVLVAGDLHGHLDNFRRLLLEADLARHPGRHLVLQELVHGPYRYPGGGDKSHQLIDLAAALVCQFPGRAHYLLGNHEQAQAVNRLIGKRDECCNALFLQGVKEAYGPRADEVYAAYLRLLAAAPVVVRTPHRLLVSHSLPSARSLPSFDPAELERDGPDPLAQLQGGSIHSLLWGRDCRPEHVPSFLERMEADLLITGHIPCDEGFAIPNEQQLILDCKGTPACYALVPGDRPLTHPELVDCVRQL